MNQIQPGFIRLLIGTGSDDYDSCIPHILIGTCIDSHLLCKGNPVADIHGFSFRFFLININKHQLIT